MRDSPPSANRAHEHRGRTWVRPRNRRFRRSILVAALSGCAALLLLYAAISAVSPMNGEDYGLAMPLDTAAAHSTLGWVVERSLHQMTHWNARLGEQLAILWLALGKPAFVVANTACFAVFCALVAWTAAGTAGARRSALFDAAFAGALAFLAWPRLEVFFWDTAAAGYLQPLALTLLVLAPFLVPDLRARAHASRVARTALVVAAIPAGASFENVGPAVALVMALATLRAWRRGESAAPWLALLAASYALGWLALALAPSTAVRARYYRDTFSIPPLSPAYLGRRALDVARVLARTTVWLGAATAVALAGARWLGARLPELVGGREGTLALSAVAATALVAFAPYSDPRAFAWPWVVLLLLATRAHHLARERRAALVDAITCGLLVAALAFGTFVYREYAAFGERVAARTQRVVAARGSDACREGLPIARIPTATSPRILNNREKWLAQFPEQVSRYFGCRVVVE